MKQYIISKVKLSVICLLALGVTVMSGCDDDIPTESYYTFTGEMMSDYLHNHADFSEFSAIVTRAGMMDQLSAYGEYTCFAPTNAAVQKYRQAKGFSSVNEIPVDVCDTIARTHLIDRMYHTADLTGLTSIGSPNMLRRIIQLSMGYEEEIKEDGTIDTLSSYLLLNKTAAVIHSLANDSVENGIMHPVDAVIEPSSRTLPDVMLDNPRISLFNKALEVTGLADYMATHIEDLSWDGEADEYADFPKIIKSNGHDNKYFIPEQRKYGFTAFVVTDDALRSGRATKNGDPIETLEDLYDYAVTIYGRNDSNPDEQFTTEALRKPENPLYKLVSYHLLDRKGLYDWLTTISTIETLLVNPTEWYKTMCPYTTMKIEKATVQRFLQTQSHRNRLFINRAKDDRGADLEGSLIEPEVEKEYEQTALNGIYYYIDKLVDYGQETKDIVFNTRMRVDIYTLFPELMSNDIRTAENYHPESENVTGRYYKNYMFPKGYLDGVDIKGDGYFLYQNCHNYYWSYEGDEFNLKGVVTDSYDITFPLPPVPTGTYQVRLGFAATGTRGVAQVYFDGQPVGIPIDMRKAGDDPSVGWINLENATEEEAEENKKSLKNNGYYRGPRSVFNIIGTGIKDGDATAKKSYFYNTSPTIRKVLCTVTIDGNKEHTLRIRSVYAEGGAELMIDYIEIVPKSVYGIEGEGLGEDDY